MTIFSITTLLAALSVFGVTWAICARTLRDARADRAAAREALTEALGAVDAWWETVPDETRWWILARSPYMARRYGVGGHSGRVH